MIICLLCVALACLASGNEFYELPDNVTVPRLVPTCSRTAHQSVTSKTTTAINLPNVNYVEIECLSFKVHTALPEGKRKGCALAPALEAHWEIEKSHSDVQRIPFHELWGGSLSGVSFTYNQKVSFQLKFTIDEDLQKCPLWLFLSITGSYGNRVVNLTTPAPIISSFFPFVVARFEPLTVLIQSFSQRETLEVVPIEDHLECSIDAIHIVQQSNFPVAKRSSQSSNVNVELFEWRYQFNMSNKYVLCAKVDATYQPLAKFVVFGSNPSYYEGNLLPGGVAARDDVYYLTFVGYDLDLRAGRDQAKFVRDTESCNGKEASEVIVYGVLQPTEMEHQTNATISFSIHGQGTFRCCYYFSAFKWWVDVPFFNELSVEVKNIVSNATMLEEFRLRDLANSPTSDPLPTTALNRSCATVAPERQRHISYLQITFYSQELPFNLFSWLADFLCISPVFIKVTAAQQNAKGGTDAILQVVCQHEMCDSSERMNFLLFTFESSNKLLEINVIALAIVNDKGFIIAGEDKSTIVPTAKPYYRSSEQEMNWSVVVIVVLVLATGFGILGYLVWRKSQAMTVGEFEMENLPPPIEGIVVNVEEQRRVREERPLREEEQEIARNPPLPPGYGEDKPAEYTNGSPTAQPQTDEIQPQEHEVNTNEM